MGDFFGGLSVKRIKIDGLQRQWRKPTFRDGRRNDFPGIWKQRRRTIGAHQLFEFLIRIALDGKYSGLVQFNQKNGFLIQFRMDIDIQYDFIGIVT